LSEVSSVGSCYPLASRRRGFRNKKPTAECQRWVFKIVAFLLVLEPPLARRVSHRDTITAQCANQRGGTHVRKHIFVTGNVHFIELRQDLSRWREVRQHSRFGYFEYAIATNFLMRGSDNVLIAVTSRLVLQRSARSD